MRPGLRGSQAARRALRAGPRTAHNTDRANCDIDGIGTGGNAPEAQLHFSTPRLGNRFVDLERRDHAGADQALRVHSAEVIEPIVVGG